MAMTKTEKLSHYAIVVIAVSAVIVSVWQVQIAHKHNKLSVRPYMDFFSGYLDENTWQVRLSNEGVGPAILKSIEVTYKGETHHNWDKMMMQPEIQKAWLNSSSFSPDTPFAANKTTVFLKLDRTELREPLGIKVKIKYESVYEEPFELNMSF